MLYIKDYKKVRILKIKDWSIDFEYDGKRYLLHGGSELGEGSWQDLYFKKLDEKGRYELEFISKANYKVGYVGNYYFGNQLKRGVTYNSLDIETFVKELTWNGLIKSQFSSEITQIKKKIDSKKIQ